MIVVAPPARNESSLISLSLQDFDDYDTNSGAVNPTSNNTNDSFVDTCVFCSGSIAKRCKEGQILDRRGRCRTPTFGNSKIFISKQYLNLAIKSKFHLIYFIKS